MLGMTSLNEAHREYPQTESSLGIVGCSFTVMTWNLVDLGTCSSAFSARCFNEYVLSKGLTVCQGEKKVTLQMIR